MAILDIVLYPNKILTTPTQLVETIDDEIRTLIDDMIETMYFSKGIGLAAPQIGVAKRITVIDVSRDGEDPDVRVLINPEILETSKETMKWEEGCLSFPDLYDTVVRPRACKVRALDRDGNEVIHEAEDLLAICMQHEIDHLDGVLFIDHLSRLKKRLALKRYKKILETIQNEAQAKAEEENE